MKYLLAIFLFITLNANSFAASGFCVMVHDNIPIKEQSMPCHEAKQDKVNTIEFHACDCDMSSQFIYMFVLNILSIPVVPDAYFNTTEHQSLTVSAKYRPPIYFLG